MKEVYDNCDFLRRLTKKHIADPLLADEAYTYAFDRLARDDWRRVRAFQGKSSFRGYLGFVWDRLLIDFLIKKFGKITPPKWIRSLGGVWEELFKLLCCCRLSIQESIETILAKGKYHWDAKSLERAAEQILARIPRCGEQVGPAGCFDDEEAEHLTNPIYCDRSMIPEEIAMDKEKWIALQAVSKVFFKSSDDDLSLDSDEKVLTDLALAIRKCVCLDDEERLILTAHFVDGQSISAIGKRLNLNQNQIHGKFRRLIERIQKKLSGIIDPYL